MKISNQIRTLKITRVTLLFTVGLIGIVVLLGIPNMTFGGQYFQLYWISSIVVYGTLWVVLLVGVSQFCERLNRFQFLVCLISLCILSRFLWIILVQNNLVSDFAIYHELAVALVSGKGYAITGPVGIEDLEMYLTPDVSLPYTTAYRAPGVPLFAAFLYLILGIHPFIFKLANVLFGVWIALLIYFLIEKEKSPSVARNASLIWAFYPSSIMATNLFGTELLFSVLLMSVAFILTQTDQRKKSYPLILFLGVVVGLTVLTRSMLLVILLSLFGAFIFKRRGSKSLTQFFATTLFVFITLTPWIFRNYKVFGKFIPVCTSEGEFLGRHSKHLVPPSIAESDEWRTSYRNWRNSNSEIDKSAEGYKMALKNIMSAPKGGFLHVLKSLYHGIRETYGQDLDILRWSTRKSFYKADYDGPTHVFDQKSILLFSSITMAFYIIIILSAFWGLWQKLSVNLLQTPGLIFLTLYFLFNFISFSIFLGQDRYHFPVMPFLIIFSAISLNLVKKNLLFYNNRLHRIARI